MTGPRECRSCEVEHSHFMPSSPTLLKVLLIVLWLSSTCGRKGALSSNVCEEIREIEVRFRDYFSEYLGSYPAPAQGEEFKHVNSGQVVQILTKSAEMCCEKVNVSFSWLGHTKPKSPIQYLVKQHFGSNNDSKKLIFYFPEFSDKGMTQVYGDAFPRPFLPILKSPGHAIVMRAAEAKKGVTPFDILLPSVPLITFLIVMAVLFGVAVWLLDHWKNREEFPSPFVVGVFEGFWWAVVTMTTVGYGDKAPRSIFARLLTILWMFTSFIFFTLIASNSTSIIATQHVSGIRRTLGLKIGALNSKRFVESEMNLGAEIIEYNHSQLMVDALENGDIDRFLFPSYVQFLIMISRYEGHIPELYVAKVLDQAFQVGLVLAQPSNLSNNKHHDKFYACLRSIVGNSETKSSSGYSMIKQTDDLTLNMLDTSGMWVVCIYIMCALGCLVSLGMAWDVWKYFKSKVKGNQSTQPIELQ